MTHFFIRPAENTPEDMDILSKFCNKLAEFDGHEGNVEPEKLRSQLFDFDTNVRAFIGVLDNKPIGFILTYECFTVYQGERGLYVPGEYIVEEHRNKIYGGRLLQHVANYALENEYEFLNWIVENDNKKANAIYKKLGASISENWAYVRVPKEIIEKLSKGEKLTNIS